LFNVFVLLTYIAANYRKASKQASKQASHSTLLQMHYERTQEAYGYSSLILLNMSDMDWKNPYHGSGCRRRIKYAKLWENYGAVKKPVN